MLRKRKKALIIRKILKKRKTGGNTEMKELAKRFIDKECLINSIDHQYEGVIKEIADGAILVEKAGMLEAISLDYIVRIREFPKNKKGNPSEQKRPPVHRQKCQKTRDYTNKSVDDKQN